MNILMIIAFLFTGILVTVVVMTSGQEAAAFLDYHALLIVLGGTMACAAIAYQADRVWLMLKIFLMRMLKNYKPNYEKTIRELMVLASKYRDSEEAFRAQLEESNDHFLKECGELLLDKIVPDEDIKDVLQKRVNTMFKRYSSDAAMFLNLSKYPPAMGLMGAVIGMIALLRSLGEAGAEQNIGPAMSIALVATFYGIALANLVVMPIGDNLMESARELKTKNAIIVEGMILIHKKTNPIVLAVELNSYLLPSERVDWKNVEKAG